MSVPLKAAAAAAASARGKAGLDMVVRVDALGQLTSAPPKPSASERLEAFKTLRAGVRDLIEAQKDTPKRHAAVGSTDFKPLLAWLEGKGVDTSRVEVASYGDAGHGLRATRDIAKGERFLAVPESAMITTLTAASSDVGPFVTSDPIVSQMPNVALALHALREVGRGKASPWAPYLATLPASYTTPLYYSDDEWELLHGTSVHEPAVALFTSIVRQFAYVYKQIHKDAAVRAQLGYSKPSQFTFEDYRWAVSAVMTRQNRVPLGGTAYEPEFGLALIPLWDLINHDDGDVTSTHDVAAKQTECAAMRPFGAGDQVYMFYGPRPNAELLLHSGFVVEGNRHDYLAVRLGVSDADPLAALKARLLSALTVPRSGEFVVGADGELDAQLNAFIRVNAMTIEELEHHLANPAACATLGERDGAVSEGNEQRTCHFFETRCKLLLAAFRSTVADDDAALAANPPYTTQCALRLRRGEKRILELAAAKVAERALEEEL